MPRMDERATEASLPFDWESFLAAHAETLRASRVPPLIFMSVDHWEDFLSHGYLDAVEDPDDFTVDELDEPAYAALRDLVTAYFDAGAPFFVPVALRSDDYLALSKRYVAPRQVE